MKSESAPVSGLLMASLFAARKHKDKKRKDGVTPYINHPLAVAELLSRVGGVKDLATLSAAVLHDTVEDTETTPEELKSLFGKEVMGIVLEVTDDKNLPKAERKQRQIEGALSLSQPARLIRIADKITNVMELDTRVPLEWTPSRKREYLDWAERVISMIRGTHLALEELFDQVVAEKRRLFAS